MYYKTAKHLPLKPLNTFMHAKFLFPKPTLLARIVTTLPPVWSRLSHSISFLVIL